MKRVTQKDIAEQLSLSVTAVSKALKNSSDISAETKQQVFEIAQRLGYQSFEKINNINKKNILFFLPFDRPYKPLGETSAYFYISAILSEFKDLDYQILILPNSTADDIDYIERMNDLYKPSAVVFTDTIVRDPRVLYCLEKDITVITQGQSDIYSQYFSIDFNESQWVIDTTEFFFSKGCKDPLLILPCLPMSSLEHRYNSFILQVKKHGLKFSHDNNIFYWEDSTSLGELQEFLTNRENYPDAVILDSEYMVMQYHKLLIEDKNRAMPFMASTTNVIDLALMLNIDCFYCWQNFWEVGKQVAKTLHYALTTDKKEWKPQHHVEPMVYFNPYI